MNRRTLYDIINDYTITPTKAFARLLHYYNKVDYDVAFLDIVPMTLEDYIEEYAFKNLPIRKAGQINLHDLMGDLGLAQLTGEKSFEDLFCFMEFIACCQDHMPRYDLFKDIYGKSIFDDISKCMDEILKNINHKFIKTKEGRIVIQNDASMEEAVLKSNNEELSVLLYKYRHYSNDLSDKKNILMNIVTEMAPDIYKAKNNKSEDSFRYQIADKINNISNNFNIRHNNKSGHHKKEYFVNLPDKDKEYWYDELYNSILIFILEKDYKKSTDLLAQIQKNK